MKSITPAGGKPADDRLLVGFEHGDDSAVWRIDEHTAAVLNVDFFTPVVDDPYEFGSVSAANALSDIYAMGATPHVALNILALDCKLGTEVASAILRGGADKVEEAGAFVCGGHTIDDAEPKYGLAAFGTVDPERLVSDVGAQAGDLLFLTKRIGTGIMSAARKIDLIDEAAMRPVIDSMAELNRAACEAMLAADVHAATDITGFGLGGHLRELLEASEVAAEVDFSALPLFEGVWQFSCDYCRPARTFSIMEDLEGMVEQGSLDDEEFDNRMGVYCDPQTSGGLLVAIAPEKAQTFVDEFRARAGRDPALIGRVVEGRPGTVRFTDS